METFEFVVTSIARVALKEHVKIQAEGVEDARVPTVVKRLHTLGNQITIKRLRRVRCVRAAQLVRAVYLKLDTTLMTLLREETV